MMLLFPLLGICLVCLFILLILFFVFCFRKYSGRVFLDYAYLSHDELPGIKITN